jgi:hypothetical protein
MTAVERSPAVSQARNISDDAAGSTPATGVALTYKAKRVGIYLGAALVIFLLGLVPMWLKAREATSQRDAARRELRLSQMQGTLASAAIDARRGEYEPARQTASDFFTTLRGQMDAGGDSAMTAQQREASAPLLARRDEVVTLLARGDPAAAEQLSDLYVSYRRALNEVQSK